MERGRRIKAWNCAESSVLGMGLGDTVSSMHGTGQKNQFQALDCADSSVLDMGLGKSVSSMHGTGQKNQFQAWDCAESSVPACEDSAESPVLGTGV
jgi:hypothetical protein